jgi:hypothetical protein
MTNSQKAIRHLLAALDHLEQARRAIPEMNQAVNAAIKAVNEIPVPERGRIVESSGSGE